MRGTLKVMLLKMRVTPEVMLPKRRERRRMMKRGEMAMGRGKGMMAKREKKKKVMRTQRKKKRVSCWQIH